jgi:hypothetical protein
VSLEMHLEAAIEGVWTCNWSPPSSEVGDALGGRDRATWEMHLEAAIERGFEMKLGGRDRATLEMYLEAAIERVWRCTWRP